jgi:hypothetical protein
LKSWAFLARQIPVASAAIMKSFGQHRHGACGRVQYP